MRTKVTINTDHVRTLPVELALHTVMQAENLPPEAFGLERSWAFPTAEQAADAVRRLEDLKRTMAAIRVTTTEKPGCLDGGES